MSYNPNNPNGQAAMSASSPVVLASDQSSIPVTVSGVATAARQDTGNTSIASIDAKTPALGQALAASSVPVVLTAAQLTTLTPPAAITGFATSEKQDTGNTSLASIDGKITAVNTGAVVVSSSALPSGAATVAAQTDKSQFTKITDGTDTALVTASGEMNVLATAQPGVDIGDVTINNPTIAVTQSGTWTVQPGNTANTTAWKVDGSAVTQPVSGTVTASIVADATTIAKAEDAASANADVGVPSMAVRKGTPANTSGTDGDYEMLQMSAGRLWTSSTIDAAIPAGTNLMGKVGIDQTTVGTTNAVSIAQLGANTVSTGNGASGTGVLRVAQANDGTGVLATVSTVTTLTGGGVAHDGADSGNPLKMGGRAINAEIAAVANNDRSDFVTDLVGKQIVLPYANPENFLTGTITTAMTGTTSTAVSGMGAPGSGLRNYITSVVISNAHATVGTDVILQDGSGGTTIGTFPAAAAYGGSVLSLPTPIRQPTANTALYAANVTTGASTKVTCYGYKGA